MIQGLISTLVGAGLVIEFCGFDDTSGDVQATIYARGEEHPRGSATATSPERALAIAATGGLASIYHRVQGGFLSLKESE